MGVLRFDCAFGRELWSIIVLCKVIDNIACGPGTVTFPYRLHACGIEMVHF